MARMTIGSCADFHTQVSKFITTATPAALHIETQALAYTAAVETLSSIVNRQRAFIATASLSEADDVRDSAVGVISNVVNAYSTSPVADKQAAAKLLKPQLSAYKGIRNHEYSKQTAEVRGMLGVLEQEDNAEAIAALGLTEEVEALRTANATFETSIMARTAEISGRMPQSDLKSEDVVEVVNGLYKNIVQVVNAYAIVQPTEAINTFIENLNGTVSYYARIAGGSPSGSTAAEDGEDGGTTPGGGSQGGGDGSDDGEL